MRLSIGHLGIHVTAPREQARAGRHCAWLLEDRLPAELSAHLGPSLARVPDVVRIRELKVRLSLRAGRIDPERLLRDWLAAFTRELFEQLAFPSEPEARGIYRVASPARLRADFLRELLRGAAERAWYFLEFAPLLRLARSAAAFGVLMHGSTDATLEALAEDSALETLLSALDDLQLEQILSRLGTLVSRTTKGDGEIGLNRPDPGPGESLQEGAPRLADFLRFVEFATACPGPPEWRIDGHRSALRLWVRSRLSGLALAPRRTLNFLRTVRHLQQHGLMPSREAVSDTQWLLVDLSRPEAAPVWNQLQPALAQLAPAGQTANALPRPGSGACFTSAFAGLLLLVPLIELSGWWSLRHQPDVAAPCFSCLLAGVALALCGQPEELQLLDDPAVYLFCGAQAPLARAVYEWHQKNVNWKAAGAHLGVSAESFAQLAANLAEALASKLARRIRGFRTLPLAGVRRLFVRRPGRMQVETDCLHVTLSPSPYHVALHLAGADVPASTSAWFENRQIVFELEGL